MQAYTITAVPGGVVVRPRNDQRVGAFALTLIVLVLLIIAGVRVADRL